MHSRRAFRPSGYGDEGRKARRRAQRQKLDELAALLAQQRDLWDGSPLPEPDPREVARLLKRTGKRRPAD